MIRIVATHDPEIMRLDNDSLPRCVFGVVFLAAMVLLPTCLTYYVAVSGAGTPLWQIALGLVLRLGGILVSLFACTFSTQTIIDRRLNKLVEWDRLILWKVRTITPLNEFIEVRVVRTTGRYISYAVELFTTEVSASTRTLIGIGATQPVAAKLAEDIADFLGLPLNPDLRGNDGAAHF